MEKNLFEKALDLIVFLFEAPYRILYLMVLGGFGYCGALMLVGVPVSIWKHVTKKKVREDIERKVIIVVAVCLTIAMFLRLLYENTA